MLALQGDVREHLAALALLGVPATTVRRPAELDAVDALVLPGGESTTMAKLARAFDLLEPLRLRVKEGMPTLGTCAGMILLADRVLDGAPGQETIGGLDVTVRRNAFGRQVDSFEGPLRRRAASPARCPGCSSGRPGSSPRVPASRCSVGWPRARRPVGSSRSGRAR